MGSPQTTYLRGLNLLILLHCNRITVCQVRGNYRGFGKNDFQGCTMGSNCADLHIYSQLFLVLGSGKYCLDYANWLPS